LLKNDPSLIYKLLRNLNSPLLGLRSEVHGLHDAIALLGETEFRRWISIVAIVTMAGDQPPELIRTALTRAFFCEAISQPIGIPAQCPDLFLMGLLSVSDALMDRPIDQVLSTLPVSADLRTALCGGVNRFRDVYEALLAYERADWPAVAGAAARLAQTESEISDCYQFASTRAAALPF